MTAFPPAGRGGCPRYSPRVMGQILGAVLCLILPFFFLYVFFVPL